MRRWFWIAALMCVQCGRTPPVAPGRYAVFDAEYSAAGYDFQRELRSDKTFSETHAVHRCLELESEGTWEQTRGTLKLAYTRSHGRGNCRQPLPPWNADSSRLDIPIRNAGPDAFESFLPPSGGQPGKWLKWIKSM